jgi:ABC-type uncharacterized transport system substrate-binding protein
VIAIRMEKKILANLLIACLAIMALALTGCTGKPATVKKSARVSTASGKTALGRTAPESARPDMENMVRFGSTTIVLSDSGETFRALADELLERFGPGTEVLTLSDETQREKLPSLLTKRSGPLVAIGLEAALALAAQDRRDVIFTMVFNYGDNRLLQRGMIGVSMLPPPAQVLRVLKELSPDTTRIIMPAGPNLGSYPEWAQTEAAKLGISLFLHEVGSDKELLLLVKGLDSTTQAVWLLPDNRITSKERLRQVLGVNLKGGRRTVVFSPSLLKSGGLLSADYNIVAIAETIGEIIGRTPEERDKMKGTMRQPACGTLAINGTIASTLGLEIPPSLEPLVISVGEQ